MFVKKHPVPETIFREAGGQMRMGQALRRGINRHTLYSLLERGVIEKVSRGVYRLSELPALSNPDLVTVGLRFPEAVVCLVSALSFHEMTTQIPHVVSIAVSRDSRTPSLDYPPLRVHRFSGKAFDSGIQRHLIDGVSVNIYSPEKTLADCFKFRKKIGMDVVLEALKFYTNRKNADLSEVLRYGKICRTDKVMMPYLEASA